MIDGPGGILQSKDDDYPERQKWARGGRKGGKRPKCGRIIFDAPFTVCVFPFAR